MTIDKDRYTLRMPKQYYDAIKRDANAIGISRSAIILRIFAEHYGELKDEAEEETA